MTDDPKYALYYAQHSRLVHKLIREFGWHTLDYSDLEWAAIDTLWNCVDQFDPTKGTKFTTLLTVSIRRRLSLEYTKHKRKKNRWNTKLGQQDHSEATTTTLPSDALAAKERTASIYKLLKHLDVKSRRMIRMHYGIGQQQRYTLQQIGDYFGITKERVRQINNRSLVLLRATGRNNEDLSR